MEEMLFTSLVVIFICFIGYLLDTKGSQIKRGLKKRLKSIFNKMPLVCGCQLCETLRDTDSSKTFDLTWNRENLSIYNSHATVTQCKRCKRFYLYTFYIYVSGYSTFSKIFSKAKKDRIDIEELREQLIESDTSWGVTEIREM